jgi:hypothetical protein
MRQAAYYNTTHALCMQSTTGYKLALIICNNYLFSTASVITRTCFNVTLYTYVLYFLHSSYTSVNPCVSLEMFSPQVFRRKYFMDLVYPIRIMEFIGVPLLLISSPYM